MRPRAGATSWLPGSPPTNDKLEIWRELRFDILFKGDDWRDTEKGRRLERDFGAVGVEIVYFPYTNSTSSSALRRALQNIEAIAEAGVATDVLQSIRQDTCRLVEGAELAA